MLNLPENRMLKYEIPDFAAFSEYFYRTDHHWNYLAPTAPIGSCSPSSLHGYAAGTDRDRDARRVFRL